MMLGSGQAEGNRRMTELTPKPLDPDRVEQRHEAEEHRWPIATDNFRDNAP